MTELEELRKESDEAWNKYIKAWKDSQKFRNKIKPSYKEEWGRLNSAYQKESIEISQKIKELKYKRLILRRKLNDDLRYIRKDRRKRLKENAEYQGLLSLNKKLEVEARNKYRIWNDLYEKEIKEKSLEEKK